MNPKNYYYEYDRDYSDYINEGLVYCNEHFHKAIELVYCISGTQRAVIDDKEIIFSEGELLFVPPFSVHSYEKCVDNKLLCAVLESKYTDEYISQTNGLCFKRLIFEASEATADIYRHLKMAIGAGELLKKGIYCYSIARLIEIGELGEEKIQTEEPFVVKTLAYINKHYNENITLQEVAEALGYSRCYFSSMFNKTFHIGFTRFLNNVRINIAIPLLREDSVSNVAFEVGFNNIQSFYQNFKFVTGTTPKAYIKE